MNNTQNEANTAGNLFVMLGQLYVENQLLRQRATFLEQQLALLQQQIVQSQQAQTNGKEPDELPEVAKKVEA